MRQVLFRGAFTILPLLFGVFLPYIGSSVTAAGHYLNPFWSGVFGLALYVDTISQASGPALPAWIDALIWPIIATTILFVFSGWLWRSGTRSQRIIWCGLLFVSFCIDIPLSLACSKSLIWWPNLYCLMFVIY